MKHYIHAWDIETWSVVRDKKEIGWARIHDEFLLLRRCPVHVTVIVIYFIFFP